MKKRDIGTIYPDVGLWTKKMAIQEMIDDMSDYKEWLIDSIMCGGKVGDVIDGSKITWSTPLDLLKMDVPELERQYWNIFPPTSAAEYLAVGREI